MRICVTLFFLSILFSSIPFAANCQTVGGSVGPDITVCSGTNSDILYLTGEVGSIVRWQYSDDNGASWKNIGSTAGLNSYSFAGLTKTTWYRAEVKLSPSPPNVTEFSAHAVVTVDDYSEAIISGATTVCTGSNSGLLSLSGAFSSVIDWEYSTNGGSSYSSLSNITTSQNFLNLTTTSIYRASIKNGVCPAAYSSTAAVTVSPTSVGGVVQINDTVCYGSNSGTLSLSGYTGDVIRWQYSDDNGASWTNISNTNNFNNYSNLTKTTSYRAVVQTDGCASDNSSAAEIFVKAASDGGSLSPSSYSACQGTNAGVISLSGETGKIIHWEFSTDGGSTWNIDTNTSHTLSFNNLNQSTRYRVKVQNDSCTAAYSTISLINVFTASAGGSILSNDTVCASSNYGTLLLSGQNGSILKWEASTNNGVSWSNISNTTPMQIYSNLSQTTLYRAVVQNGSCAAANSLPVQILVHPLSDGGTLPAAPEVCDSTSTYLLQLNNYTGGIQYWERSFDHGNTWDSILSTADTISVSGITQETWYRANVKSGKCSSAYSTTSKIDLSAPPVAGFNTSVNGATVIFSNTSTSNGGTYIWNFGDGSFPSAVTSPAHTYTANGTYSVTLLVQDSCNADSMTQSISINGLSINEIYGIKSFSIYPVPAKEIVTAEWISDNKSVISLEIMNLAGQRVLKAAIEKGPGNQKHILDISELESGFYFIRLISDNCSLTRPFSVAGN